MKKTISLIYLLIFGIGIITVNSQITTSTINVGSGVNQMSLTLTVNSNTSTVDFILSGPATKWFGFGFATTSMANGSYTILGNVSNGNPLEYNQINHSTPNLQSVQNLTNISSSTSGGVKTYTFSRAINTGDVNDYTFPTTITSFNVIWAYGSSTSLAYHSGKGVALVSMSNACNIPITNLAKLTECVGDSTVIFGNYQTQAGVYYDTLQSTNGCDSVLSQELVIGQPYFNQLPTINICNGDSVMVFGNWISQAGIYYDSLLSFANCDSVNKVVVNIPIVDTMVFESGNGLFANAFSTSYQWYDCQTNQAIAGETNHTFYPTQSGSYKVEITVLNCSEMSNCHSFIATGIENSEDITFKIWPNPANRFIQIEFDKEWNNVNFTLYAIDGTQVLQASLSRPSNRIAIDKLAKGLYFYKISNKNNLLKTQKLVIQ